jgi:peptidoglycan/xylan/chitin deacetylase (PgdA/CDA1 family)
MASVRTHIETTDHVIALTLDDGYAPDDALLAYLESNGLHGTAFIVGQVAEADPAFVRRIVDMGWMVCSHTYRHRILTRLSDAEMREEITRGADAIADIVGYHCPYFRTPGGAVDSRVAAMATELGLELIGWNASLSDSSPGVHAADQVRVALNDVRPGSILLGHWGGIHSLAVLTQVLDALKAQDYQVLSVAELLGDAPIASASPSPPPPMRLPAATTSQGEHFEWSHIMVASIPGAIGVVVSGAFGVLTRRSRRRRTKAYSQA